MAEASTRKPSRIQQRNRKRILDAALEVFSRHGYRGATLDLIAEEAASLIDCHGIVSDHPGPTFDKPLYRDDARRLAHVVGIGLER